MPRTYKCKRSPSKRWKQEDLDAALGMVQSGVSIAEAARRCGIPRTTLSDHARGKYSRVGAGRPTVLTPQEEKELVVSCQILQQMGFGLTKEFAPRIVMDYMRDCGHENLFKGEHPGPDWWQCILQR